MQPTQVDASKHLTPEPIVPKRFVASLHGEIIFTEEGDRRNLAQTKRTKALHRKDKRS